LFSACSDPEDCTLGSGDEDGDGLADCQDSDCAAIPQCAPENCTNGIDDNGNGAIDCQESSCSTTLQCLPEILCSDNIDNNLDGKTDCEDTDCSVDAACIETGECQDGLDNDNDGDTDCDDSDCGADPDCFPESQCGLGAFVCCDDGVDNNGNGTADCQDPSCAEPCLTLNCGNGLKEGAEACDDGNNSSGDCCSSDCSEVTCESEIEPNNAFTDATGPLELPTSIAGSIGPTGTDSDFYSVNLILPGKIRFETSGGSGLGACVGVDTTITIFNINGTTQLGTNNDDGVSNCSLFTTGNLPPGIYFVKVTSQISQPIAIYQLHASDLVCGNNNLDTGSSEECDNGLNCSDGTSCTSDTECVAIGDGLCALRNGDGCDILCKREPLCGDNILTSPPELCEDGSTCSDGATICNGNAALCIGIGDGACTPKSGDGCDSNCRPTGCRNFIVTAGEECDDGNNINGDGCDQNCTLSVCGNSLVGPPAEDCDTANLNGASCVSLGFASGSLACVPAGQANECFFNTAGCVASICGNGVTETGEECDDGNANNGDSCSSLCLFEIIFEGEPNDVTTQADGPFTSPFLSEGGLSPATEADFFAFTLNSFGALRIETFDGLGPTTCAAIDTKVDLLAPNGTTLIISDDNDGNGNCSLINPAIAADAAARNLAPGTYFIKISKGAAGTATAPAYRLQVSLAALCGNNVTETALGEGCDDGNLIPGDGCDSQCRAEVCGNNRLDAGEECDDANILNGDCCSSLCVIESSCLFESEPNNTFTDADGPVAAGIKVAADISPNADADFFSIVIPNRADLKIETQNLANNNCNGSQDTVLDFLAPNGTTVIASNNDIVTANKCSRVDGTGTAAVGAPMRNLAPGTYFAKITENGNNGQINDYRMIVTFVALCGNGTPENSEACDDGNQVEGDGCENNCIITPACGNNLVEAGEECDGGNNVPGDGCNEFCQREPVCGDNLIDAPEQCDDGNTLNGDCCSSTCQPEASCISELEPNNSAVTATGPILDGQKSFGAINPIGDLDFYSITVPAEADLKLQTSNGTVNSCAANQDTVIRFFAPDGVTQLGTNDDITLNVNRCSILDGSGSAAAGAPVRNLAPGTYFLSVEEKGNNGAIALYQMAVTFTALCGNGTTEAPNEACDDGNLINGDGCQANCTVTPACGNSFTEAGEQCDDGNLISGDGCNSICQDEFCGDLLTNDTNETCDDGNLINNDSCLNTCRSAACGDGVLFGSQTGGPEQCDNGGANSDTNPNACRTDCTLPSCGDGAIDTGELCDDGNTDSGDGCDATCDLEFCGDGISNDAGQEECDDANNSNSDDCTNTCEVAVCGDGFTFNTAGGNEQCDDGNVLIGDGCDGSCFIERTNEIEPNNSIAQAQANGINVTIDQMMLGAITPVGDSDFYQLTLTSPKTIRLETFDANFGSCASIDTSLEVFNAVGTKLTTINNGGIGLCSKGQIALPTGTFFVRVFEFGDNAIIPAYSLFIDFP
jgi:cysteine-rich repeat protein